MAAEIDKEKAVETARISKQIAILETEEREARTAAQKAEAEAEREQKAQAIITVQDTARANRDKQTAIIKAEESAQGARIAAEQDAFKVTPDAETSAAAVLARAESEASAIVTLADANRKKGESEAAARRLEIEAENRVDSKLLLRDVTLKALEVLPAVTRELMAPARAIGEIKILQLQGGPAGGSRAPGEGGASNGPLGIASPVLSTILEAGAAYPLLKELLGFAQVDTADLADKARSAPGDLPAVRREAVTHGAEPVVANGENQPDEPGVTTMIAKANGVVRNPVRQALALAVSAGIASGVRRGGTPFTLRALEDRVREAARSDPLGALLSLVGGASVLFYWAERGRNPRSRR